MTPFWLRVRAPFAAFRWLQAGVYRASSPTIPPSAAWGLVLNLAGVETRDTTPSVTTLRRTEVPKLQIAIGEVRAAQFNSLYQQLHGYPVGNSGKELAERAHGSKFWIVPVRREILTDVDIVIGVRDSTTTLAERVASGLRGAIGRYGLPFLGDNNFLIDRIEMLAEPSDVQWYCRLGDDDSDAVRNTCRLTVDIDRQDSAKTRSELFRRLEDRMSFPPEAAWTWVPQVQA